MTEEVMSLANSPVLWIIALFIIGMVIFQAIMFYKIAKEAAPAAGLNEQEVKRAARTGFISSIGPSFGIAIVIISLLALLGSPITLMRIGIVGSAATETAAAQIGANAFGVELGGDGFNMQAFTTMVWTMCLGGMGWLLFTLFFTKSLGKTESKVRKKNPKVMAVVSLAAMLGAFGYLLTEQMVKGLTYSGAAVISLVIMVLIMKLADKKDISWLREWSLGISMVCGMVGGSLLTALM
ncbi:DUF5058 family protein [Salinicoccus kekensis]|uniref:Uncharacterized protein DUF5058 n=1 Tax=Salinicoccus kekensis TaxID=714307 RepID=A0A285UNG9_9STAP|nr:DUF5058 family protein [Salinicoccus kekensis]SOC43455.1 uncharacterized protein DUF5058 [Salinicoccus kekensis]